MTDYLRAMEQIEGAQIATMEQAPVPENAFILLDKLGQGAWSDKQRQILDELRRCLLPQELDC
jgi:hypothetical protein